MNKYHLRFTPLDLKDFNIQEFVESVKAKKYVVGKEGGTPELKLHYHFYIETELSTSTMKLRIYKHLRIPKTGVGKESAYYMLKDQWEGIGYICKSGEIVVHFGYTPKEIEDAIKEGKASFLDKKPSKKDDKKKSEFTLLLEEYESKGLKGSMTYNKKFIKSYYLKQRKAIPRQGDIQRYAYSIYAIVHKMTEIMNIELADKVELEEMLGLISTKEEVEKNLLDPSIKHASSPKNEIQQKAPDNEEIIEGKMEGDEDNDDSE